MFAFLQFDINGLAGEIEVLIAMKLSIFSLQ